MEETYKKELGAMKWLVRLTERLTILTTSMRLKTDLGLTDDDKYVMIEALNRVREFGWIPMYENIVINRDDDSSQSVTQTNLFHDEISEVSTTAQVNSLGIDIDTPAIETKNKKK